MYGAQIYFRHSFSSVSSWFHICYTGAKCTIRYKYSCFGRLGDWDQICGFSLHFPKSVSHSLSTSDICYLDTFTYKHFFCYAPLKVNGRFSVDFTKVKMTHYIAKKDTLLDDAQLVCIHSFSKFYSFTTSLPLRLEKCNRVCIFHTTSVLNSAEGNKRMKQK